LRVILEASYRITLGYAHASGGGSAASGQEGTAIIVQTSAAPEHPHETPHESPVDVLMVMFLAAGVAALALRRRFSFRRSLGDAAPP
jgi:hypothetical protein